MGLIDMKFVLMWKQKGGKSVFEEEYEKSRTELLRGISTDGSKLSPKRLVDFWSRSIIKWFNETEPNPKAIPRQYVSSRLIDEAPAGAAHDWEKTNLVTIMSGTGFYDTYKCRVCGVTATRYGTGERFTLDKKYAKTAVYVRCDTAAAHLAKKAASK